MAPTPLPENPFQPSAFHSEYNRCLTLEAEASWIESVEGCPPPIVCARLLGHLLRLAPTGNGQGQVQRDIASKKDHAGLMQLAEFYVNRFIRTFRRKGGPTPAPSKNSSRPSFENSLEYSEALMEECTLDHHNARIQAMLRDNNRCVITNLEDYNQPDGSIVVQTAHIIPQSLNTNISEPGKKRSQSTNMWSILSMFTHDTIIEDLAGNRIHRLENIISLNIASHQLFDELKLWLKPIEGAPHRYRVCTAKDSLRSQPPLPEYVTLSTTESIPLPNPDYLGLHALCCEVAWMSGAAEYVTDVERRMDRTKVLAYNGSGVDLLMAALSIIRVY